MRLSIVSSLLAGAITISSVYAETGTSKSCSEIFSSEVNLTQKENIPATEQSESPKEVALRAAKAKGVPAAVENLISESYENPYLALLIIESNKEKKNKDLIKVLNDLYWKLELQRAKEQKRNPVPYFKWESFAKKNELSRSEAIEQAKTIEEFQASLTDLAKLSNKFRPNLVKHKILSFIKRLISLPRSIYRIHTFVKGGFEKSNLDANANAFYGFGNTIGLDGKPVADYRQRRWKQASPSNMGPQDVLPEISPREMAAIAKVAAETEAPIVYYSLASGRTLMELMQSLAKFMGKDPNTLISEASKVEAAGDPRDVKDIIQELDAWQKANPGTHRAKSELVERYKKWCSSAWCEEERRHAASFEGIIKRIIGEEFKADDNPDIPNPPTEGEMAALYHVYQRYASEIGATSSYIVMAIHSRDALHDMITNVLFDELKHMTIVGGAERYLIGNQPLKRLRGIMSVFKSYSSAHSSADVGRTAIKDGEVSNLTFLEVLFAGIFSYHYMQKYLDSLPVQVLQKVYEYDVPLSPSAEQDLLTAKLAEMGEDAANKLTEAEKVALAKQELEKLKKDLEEKKVARIALERWQPQARTKGVASLKFSQDNAVGIRNVVQNLLGGFEGANKVESPESEAMLVKIRTLSPAQIEPFFPGLSQKTTLERNQFKAALNEALTAELRVFQVLNNPFEVARRQEAYPKDLKTVQTKLEKVNALAAPGSTLSEAFHVEFLDFERMIVFMETSYGHLNNLEWTNQIRDLRNAFENLVSRYKPEFDQKYRELKSTLDSLMTQAHPKEEVIQQTLERVTNLSAIYAPLDSDTHGKCADLITTANLLLAKKKAACSKCALAGFCKNAAGSLKKSAGEGAPTQPN